MQPCHPEQRGGERLMAANPTNSPKKKGCQTVITITNASTRTDRGGGWFLTAAKLASKRHRLQSERTTSSFLLMW